MGVSSFQDRSHVGEEAASVLPCAMPVSVNVALSESEDEAETVQLPPPPALGPPRKRKRSQPAAPKQEDPVLNLRSILGKACKCKKRRCREPFRVNPSFQQLLNYRDELSALRKLDKDHLAARPRVKPLKSESTLDFAF